MNAWHELRFRYRAASLPGYDTAWFKSPTASSARRRRARACQALTFETGEGGRLVEGVIDDGAVYVRNVIKWLKMIDGEPVAPEKTWVMKELLGLRTQGGGLLLARARLGDVVDEGAYLAPSSTPTAMTWRRRRRAGCSCARQRPRRSRTVSGR